MGNSYSRALSGGHWGGAGRRELSRHRGLVLAVCCCHLLSSSTRTTCYELVIAVTYFWHRVANQSSNYDIGTFWLAAIPSGSTVRRIRFGWGLQGFTEVTTDLHAVSVNPVFAGVVTTIGDGTEAVPSPLTTPDDVSPPTQRWLWWEIRQPRCASLDAAGNVASWTDSGGQEVTDVQTMVKATGIPGGDTLNVWFSWNAVFGGWDTTGQQQIFAWSSLLYSTP